MTLRVSIAELVGIRSFPVKRPFGVHLVFYRAARLSVTIERVMHGARELSTRLLEEPGK